MINDNIFELIGKKWMLITPSGEKANPMTASWGFMGVIWNKDVVNVFIRPTRFTYELMEKTEYFSISFLDEKHREILNYCGTHSGRDVDKVKKTGLSLKKDGEFYLYGQSFLTVCCRKLYYQDINPQNFLDEGIQKLYPKFDYHRCYIGEINKVIQK